MKTEKETVYVVLSLIAIIIFLGFLKIKKINISTINKTNILKSNNAFNVSNIIDNSWEKVNDKHTFWFPKNNIAVVKTVDGFYRRTSDSSNLLKDLNNYSETSSDIKNIIKKLTDKGFVLDKSTSGLFGKLDFNPYYLINFQKGKTWCQIEHQFEFTTEKNEFFDGGYSFACFDFDLNQSYEQQNKYYQLLPKDSQSNNFSQAINSVQNNPSGYIKININTKFDSDVFIFDKNNKSICEGKPCCDDSSKDNPILWNKNWCLNYQIIY